MPQPKKTKTKATRPSDETERKDTHPITIERREFDLEGAELGIPEKVEEEDDAVDDGESDETSELDEFSEEEIDPFNDKWEE